jgi:uridylate kinase
LRIATAVHPDASGKTNRAIVGTLGRNDGGEDTGRSVAMKPGPPRRSALRAAIARLRQARRASRALTRIFPTRLLRVMRDSQPDPRTKYKRVILKLSGEVLRGGKSGDPIDGVTLSEVCSQVKEIHELGVEVCVVIGGGNIFRGLNGEKRGVDRTTGDYMGMLATVINGLALMDCLEKLGVNTRVQSAIPMNQIAEPFILRRAIRHLEKGRVVIFVAGTGNPYFSTDTTAALRASEMHADIIMKATKVDGIYDKDPKKHPDAVKYDQISFIDALKQRLNVMDSTAFSLCMDNNVPILVFDLNDEHAIRKAILGEKIGTLVRN